MPLRDIAKLLVTYLLIALTIAAWVFVAVQLLNGLDWLNTYLGG